MSNTPEVRMNPANGAVVVRVLDSTVTSQPWRGLLGVHFTDAQVATWTPMVPVRGKR